MNLCPQLQNLTPRPASVVAGEGFLKLAPAVSLTIEGDLRHEANDLASFLETLGIRVVPGSSPAHPFVSLKSEVIGTPAAEGYLLTVSSAGVEIIGGAKSGVHNGIQTLKMMLLGDDSSRASAPLCTIEDYPLFSWRGFMLDVSRHYFTTEELKRYVDLLALHKLNVFHIHFTDDGGWRIPVPGLPRLTEVGAWRKKKEFLWDYADIDFPEPQEGEARYGGFYELAELKDLVEYAARRNVAIVPEIELPGHALAACCSQPEICCTEEAVAAFRAKGGLKQPNVMCAGSDETFSFIEKVIDAILPIFPSEVIHIGGDEVDKTLWRHCSKCRKRMEEHGLQNEEELQSWFIRRVEGILSDRGRKLMGWDEILEGGLAPNALVMSWRGRNGGLEAARAGHHVVMTPTSYCYFDYDYSVIDTARAAAFDPLTGLSESHARFVLGGQANLWTEFVPTMDAALERTFPRLGGTAEALWSGPRSDFAEAKLEGYLDILRRLGIPLHRPGEDPIGAYQEGVCFLEA